MNELLTCGNLDQRSHHVRRDGVGGDDNHEGDRRVGQHARRLLDFRLVSTGDHPKDSAVDEKENEDDAQGSQSDLDGSPHDECNRTRPRVSRGVAGNVEACLDGKEDGKHNSNLRLD